MPWCVPGMNFRKSEKSKVLGNQKAFFSLGRSPDIVVVRTLKPFAFGRIDVFDKGQRNVQIARDVLVEPYLHLANPNGNGGDGLVFERGCRGKSDRSPQVVFGQRRERLPEAFKAVAFGEAGKDRTQRDARSLEDEFSSAHLGIANDILPVVHECIIGQSTQWSRRAQVTYRLL